MTTSVSSAVKFFPKPQEGFTTTTSGSISSGATSVGLNSTGNYTNGDVVVLIIEPGVSGKEQSFTGTIDTSGVQVTGVKWTSGTNSAHSAGVTVVDYVAAAHIQLISTGILLEHDQDGTHGNITGGTASFSGAVSTDTINEYTAAAGVTIDGLAVKDGALVTANSVIANNITAGAVTNAKLATSTGEVGGAWQSWTPTWANLTVGDGTVTAKYLQIGKSVQGHVHFVFGTTSSVGTRPTFTLPVTSVATLNALRCIGYGNVDAGGGGSNGFPAHASTTTAEVRRWDGNNDSNTVTSIAPATWSTGDYISLTFFYEAA